MRGFNTRAVHGGEIKDQRFGNVVTPIFENATFLQPNPSEEPYIDRTRDEPFLYTRWGNPTIQSFEEKYSLLENCKYALCFSSGMAAISSLILSQLKKGDKLLAIRQLYGQTFYLFHKILPRYGIKVDFIDIDSLNFLEIKNNYNAVYTESITNPLIQVSDLEKISKFCKENSMKLFVDATFATPYNQRPLELGANAVLHSGTKYLSGHSDVIIGLCGTNDEFIFNELVDARKTFGGSADPLQAYLALRGMKTLGLRIKKQNENAKIIAEFLKEHPKIKRVYYPGLKDSEYHEIASRVLKGYGAMLSFELKDPDSSVKFMKNLKIFISAPSLGGVESLITRPVETSHKSVPEEERIRMGITDSLIRVSVGIEDPEDLLEDIGEALRNI